jgi:hypothetical protein
MRLTSCCGHKADCPKNNPLAESGHSGLIITHLGHILKYVPASHAHILYNGTHDLPQGRSPGSFTVYLQDGL